MTAPPASGRGAPESPGRGLKRKLGCIESTTWIGRKRRLESEYELGGEIGEGNFGSVRICRAKVEGEEFACKALPKNGEETVHREVEIMQHLPGHPSVVTLKAVFEDADKFYLIMELCSDGGLLDKMAREGRFSEQRAAIVIKDLMAVALFRKIAAALPGMETLSSSKQEDMVDVNFKSSNANSSQSQAQSGGCSC